MLATCIVENTEDSMGAMGFPKKAYMEFRVSVVLKTGQVALAKVSLDAG